jgi:hypothetical protein
MTAASSRDDNHLSKIKMITRWYQLRYASRGSRTLKQDRAHLQGITHTDDKDQDDHAH